MNLLKRVSIHAPHDQKPNFVMYEYREALIAEIAFWRELLNDSNLNSDSPEY